VTPYVDGTSLAALVEAHERAKEYDPAGGYGGLITAYFKYGRPDEIAIDSQLVKISNRQTK
jgi:hypothetical protein